MHTQGYADIPLALQMRLCHHLSGPMVEDRHGTIIDIASIAGGQSWCMQHACLPGDHTTCTQSAYEQSQSGPHLLTSADLAALVLKAPLTVRAAQAWMQCPVSQHIALPSGGCTAGQSQYMVPPEPCRLTVHAL